MPHRRSHKKDAPLIEAWRDWAMADAERRGHQGLKPLMEGLARATVVLRQADWNADASAVARREDSPGE